MPPIINNCQILNAFSNKEIFIAYQKKNLIKRDFIDEIRKLVKANSLKFQTIDNMIKFIGLEYKCICCVCIKEKNAEDEEKKELKSRINTVEI